MIFLSVKNSKPISLLAFVATAFEGRYSVLDFDSWGYYDLKKILIKAKVWQFYVYLLANSSSAIVVCEFIDSKSC